MEEQQPLVSQVAHLRINNNSDEGSSIENEALSSHETNYMRRSGGATVWSTSLNMAKMCMGTGTLALPFAAEKGGLLFNAGGLFLIGLWNYYSAFCLLRCLEYLPHIDEAEKGKGVHYGSMNSSCCGTKQQHEHDQMIEPPPPGTTAYGVVAWYASGHKGLMVLDLLMLLLFFGLLIAYEVAMMSFINDIEFTTGHKKIDLLIPSSIIAILSCARDISFLTKFSGLGLLAVGMSFVVISAQGFEENGCSGFRSTLELNLWPESLSDASLWFGVVVFGFGVVPFVFNFRGSMACPQHVGLSLQIGLFLVYVGYLMMSNFIRVLYSPSNVFDGDVLQAMPNNWISLIVRLLMTFMVTTTAPLIVVPCGELIEGKWGIDSTIALNRIIVRVPFCVLCTFLSDFLPNGFVHVVSFIGCFCVAIAGFVLPPLFCMQLSNQRRVRVSRRMGGTGGIGIDSTFLCDFAVLVLGILATTLTSALTFRELMARAELSGRLLER